MKMATTATHEIEVEAATTHVADFRIFQLAEPERVLRAEGMIKWDGCMDWTTMPDNECVHFCWTDDIDDFAEALKAVYALAPTVIEAWHT